VSEGISVEYPDEFWKYRHGKNHPTDCGVNKMREVIVEKLWGQERILHNDHGYCMKELTLNLGWQSSMHKHIVKRETFMAVEGIAELELDGVTMQLNAMMNDSDFVTIAPGQWHRFVRREESRKI
jgi:mannose-6-phosphate isomerase-like protein (cupin superfamily)